MATDLNKIINKFREWYQNAEHKEREAAYDDTITYNYLSSLNDEDFKAFFKDFAWKGGLVQSGGYRTAPKLISRIEDNFQDFKTHILLPFQQDFDLDAWLEWVENFKYFGSGIATIFLNRVDRTRYSIVNNKSVKAYKLLGYHISSGNLNTIYWDIHKAQKDLMSKFPVIDNFYKADALTQFLVGEEEGKQLISKYPEISNTDLEPVPENEMFTGEPLQEYIDLLQYKKQIILQGAPGTGKTYAAQNIARSMTQSNFLGNVREKINAFFRNFDASNKDIMEQRQKDKQLLQQFQAHFPKEKLRDLTLENYVIGTGVKHTFCWWLIHGLKDIGYYRFHPKYFFIFWDREMNIYNISPDHAGIMSNTKDMEEAMAELAEKIHDFVVNKDTGTIRNIFDGSLILTILHAYYPDDYFPVNHPKVLVNALKLLGINTMDKDIIEKNKALQQFFEKKKAEYKADVTNLEFMRFLYKQFDLKGDIAIHDEDVSVAGEYKTIQFHPAYTYEDFVRGIVVETDEQHQVHYMVKDKILMEFAQKAHDNPSAAFVLVIDEINRANLPAVLGELIYALEYRYDPENPEETTVESMYAMGGQTEANEEARKLSLPENLYIIGTMNTADRSVGHIDYAIRRRFAFVDVHPQRSVIETEKGRVLFDQVAALFTDEYQENHTHPKPSENLSPEFNPLDVMPGHSYFMGDEANLPIRLDYEIRPILQEYLKDGVLLQNAAAEIRKLGV